MLRRTVSIVPPVSTFFQHLTPWSFSFMKKQQQRSPFFNTVTTATATPFLLKPTTLTVGSAIVATFVTTSHKQKESLKKEKDSSSLNDITSNLKTDRSQLLKVNETTQKTSKEAPSTLRVFVVGSLTGLFGGTLGLGGGLVIFLLFTLKLSKYNSSNFWA